MWVNWSFKFFTLKDWWDGGTKILWMTALFPKEDEAWNHVKSYCSSLPYGTWAKAGTIGTYLSTKLGVVGLYNKPLVKMLIDKKNVDRYLEYDPTLGYRQDPKTASRLCVGVPRKDDRANAHSSNRENSKMRPDDVDRPVDPLVVVDHDYNNVGTLGSLIVLSDGSVTCATCETCSHPTLMRVGDLLCCKRCGLNFLKPQPLAHFLTLLSPEAIQSLTTSFRKSSSG